MQFRFNIVLSAFKKMVLLRGGRFDRRSNPYSFREKEIASIKRSPVWASSRQFLSRYCRNDIRFLVVGILTLIATSAYSQQVTIKPAVIGQELTVGDHFLYTDSITAPSGAQLQLIPPQEKLGDAEILSPVYKVEKTPPGSIVYACTLAVFQPGQAKIPTLSFALTDNSGQAHELAGDSLTINIHSILPPDTTGLQIADIKGPRRLRGPIWPYFLIPLLLAGIIFGGKKARQLMRGKTVEPSVPPVPPWEIAIQRLDELKKGRHIEFGRFKEFYFELSLIIRGYIEGRYETSAVESTTFELESNDILKNISDDLYKQLFKFFWNADLIKFAKSIPTAKDADNDISFAYDFVIKTKPAPVVALPEAPAEAKAEAENVQV
jgi:hypothetical protein